MVINIEPILDIDGDPYPTRRSAVLFKVSLRINGKIKDTPMMAFSAEEARSLAANLIKWAEIAEGKK